MTPKQKPAKMNEQGWLEEAVLQPIGSGTPIILEEAVLQPIGSGTPIIPEFLVIHFTSGASAQSSIDYWKKINNGILAHFVIDRDGTIYQCRSAHEKCGHAGKSRWIHKGETYIGLNSNSIGIELANGGNTYPDKFSNLPVVLATHKNGGPLRAWEQYPEEQLEACAKLCKALVDAYPILDIVGHDDIAPKRKLDPGPAFPMDWLRNEVNLE